MLKFIRKICGEAPKYIRPPYGLYDKNLLEETNLTPIIGTVDPRDWSVLNTKEVVDHIIKRTKNGDVILLHDIFDTSVAAALQVIDILTEKGYTFVTIDEFYQSQ